MTFRNRSQGGFTLIELAIVLVIIGLIIGAVIKGQDLIDNARAKKLASFLRQAEIAQWTVYDRLGRFAGDNNDTTGAANPDGIIGVGDDEVVSTTMANQRVSSFSDNATIGGSNFILYYGQFGIGAADPSEPVIVLCKNSGCTQALSETELIWAQSVDVAIDGVADANSGKVAVMDAAPNDFDDTNGTCNMALNRADNDDTWINATPEPVYGILYFFGTQGLD